MGESTARVAPVEREDAAWVLRALAGDRAAEEQLYRAHVDAVSGLALRLLGRRQDAEDITQDVFVTALSRLGQLREPAALRSWLLRITVHEAHRRFRRRKLLRTLGFDRDAPDAGLAQLAAPQLSADGRAELGRIDAVLLTLPARERLCWLLRHVEGYELTEVASACEASLASIKRWLGRAETRVRAHVTWEADDV
jgi:RNA polymerase sigma-70 factor, ECF subfamily